MEALAARIREMARAGALDGRLGDDDPLSSAIDELLDRVAEERRQLRRDANVGRRVLELSRMGVVLVDGEGDVAYVNPKGRKILEPRAEPIGRKPIETVALAELQEAVSSVLRGGEIEGLECSTGRRDLVITATSLADGGALVMLRDITNKREAQRARTDFVANVSHELRTPVAAIMGYAETLVLEKERMPGDLGAMVEKVDRNARRLRDLFEDLLQLHRVEARGRQLPLKLQPLRPILEEALIGAADRAVQNGLQFDLRCSRSLEAWCNAGALRTIVANLASNAVSYTPEGGSITVTAEEQGDRVLVKVVDTGIGIDRLHHKRIFERFYRVDAARSRQLGGTGLGLALVKHLALASRCHVTVDSVLGQGSTFTVHLKHEERP
ncbi:MAG: PAS domain-containing protein [Alphaproteobacteria bacterium]|nr:PAS domain-containing protein [Alphaproteobacteria bacterium]